MALPNVPSRPSKTVIVTLCLLALLVLAGSAWVVERVNEVRRQNAQEDCRENMKQVLVLCLMHAEAHGEDYPDRFSELALPGGSTPEAWVAAFRCPGTGKRPGPWATVDEWTDYRLAHPEPDGNAATTVLMYEPFSNHDERGAHVGFADGRVVWLAAEQVLTFFEQSAEVGE